MKKIIRIFFIITLVCFSFFYTDKVMNYLNSKLQVIITTVSLENFDNKILSCAKIFNIENGKLKIQRGDFNE